MTEIEILTQMVHMEKGVWWFSPNTEMMDPGYGNVRFDSNQMDLVTQIAISRIMENNVDNLGLLLSLRVGDTITFEEQESTDNWARYEIAAAPTHYLNWFLIPINFISGTGGHVPGYNVRVIFAFTESQSGGTGGGYTDEQAQDAVVAMLSAGTHVAISIVYDDTANSLSFTNTDRGTVAVTNHEAASDPHLQYTTVERSQDATANLFSAGVHIGISFSYDDTANALSATVHSQMSIDNSDPAGLKLINDQSAPGSSYYYGTDGTGAKGFFALPAATKEGMWRYSNNQTMAEPVSGAYRINASTFGAATQLAISVLTDRGLDFTNTLKMLEAGDIIEIQDQNVSANWIRYDITATPTNNTTWFLIPVAVHSGGGSAVTNNELCLVSFILTGAGGGAGGTGTVTSITAGTGLTGGTITTTGTIAADWGTGTNQIRHGDDPAYTNSRTPTAHATSHQPGGSDPMSVDAVATTGSLRTIGTGALQACAGNDSRLSDSRTPTGPAGGDLSGTYPNPTVTFLTTNRNPNLVYAGPASGAAAVPTFRPLAPADGPLMVGAGAGHAAGLVPDPGATAHPNTQWALLDRGSYAVIKGQLLGHLSVTTGQSTGSTTFVDLTTPDVLTFTLDQTSDLLLEWYSIVYSAGGLPCDCIVGFFLDGVQKGADSWSTIPTSFPAGLPQVTLVKVTGVAAGPHEVRIKHRTNTAGQNPAWHTRNLMVRIVA